MTENNTEQFLALLNRQKELQENLTETLVKADSMAQVMLGEDFLESSREIIYNYLWALSDLVEKAKNFGEDMLDMLLDNIRTSVEAGFAKKIKRESSKEKEVSEVFSSKDSGGSK